MKKLKTSKKHMAYTVKWDKTHKAQHRYYDYKSHTNTFINRLATVADLRQVIEKARKRYREM